MAVVVRSKSTATKIVIAITYLIILFCTAVQILLVQYEIGLLWLFLPPTMVCASTLLVNYWKCLWVDSSIRSIANIPTIQTEGWRFCPYSGCNGSVPVNSRHCHQCDVCVIQRDHHCHFTGACVGQNNLPFFLVLVTSMFALTATFVTANFIYVVTHETPWTLLLTVLAPIQVLWYVLGYVSFSHCLISLNIVISTLAFVGAIVLLYHEYNLIFHNKPSLTRSMPIASSGVVKMSRWERIHEVFGKHWYMFYIDPTHQTSQQRKGGVTKVM